MQGQVSEKSFPPGDFCAPEMRRPQLVFAYVSVVDHPFFAVTDTNGYFNARSCERTYTLAAGSSEAGRIGPGIAVTNLQPVETVLNIQSGHHAEWN